MKPSEVNAMINKTEELKEKIEINNDNILILRAKAEAFEDWTNKHWLNTVGAAELSVEAEKLRQEIDKLERANEDCKIVIEYLEKRTDEEMEWAK